jgi:multicomponent Na+:H+ antiporter subunit E
VIAGGSILPIFAGALSAFQTNIHDTTGGNMSLILFILWLLFCGRVTVDTVLFGLGVSAVLTLFFHRYLGLRFRSELRLIGLLPLLVRFFGVLFWEIVKANVEMARIVLLRRLSVEPTLVTFRSPLRTDWICVMLAEAITLTPGTITASVDKGVFTVHCLHRELIAGLRGGELMRLLKRMELAWSGAPTPPAAGPEEGEVRHG